MVGEPGHTVKPHWGAGHLEGSVGWAMSSLTLTTSWNFSGESQKCSTRGSRGLGLRSHAEAPRPDADRILRTMRSSPKNDGDCVVSASRRCSATCTAIFFCSLVVGVGLARGRDVGAGGAKGAMTARMSRG